MKILIRVLILTAVATITFQTTCFGTIDFTGGKWGTSFGDGCTATDQSLGLAVSCDDITGFSGNTFARIELTDGVSNNWELSGNGTNEWYYSPNDLPTNTGLEKSILVGTLEYLHPTNAAAGSALGTLVAATAVGGNSAPDSADIGDNDTLGYNTVYRHSADDPDLETNGTTYIYWARTDFVAGDYVSSIETAANNPAGPGDKGFRAKIANGLTINTGFLGVELQSPEPEIWLRWYMKIEEEFDWIGLATAYPTTCVPDGPLMVGDMKNVYLKTTGGAAAVAQFIDNTYRIWATNSLDFVYPQTTGLGNPTTGTPQEGWTDVMGADLCLGGGSDGLWHQYEIKIKMNSALGVADGEGQIFLDGVLKVNISNVDWAGNTAAALDGWITADFSENNRGVYNQGIVRSVDYDDLAIWVVEPPNTCDGVPCIGLIDQPAPPSGAISISNTGTNTEILNTGRAWTVEN